MSLKKTQQAILRRPQHANKEMKQPETLLSNWRKKNAIISGPMWSAIKKINSHFYIHRTSSKFSKFHRERNNATRDDIEEFEDEYK